MPFFSRHEPEQAPVVEQPPKKHGLFSRRDPSPVSSNSASSRSNGYNNGYNGAPQRHSTDAGASRRTGVLSRFGNNEMDPSIVQARERVLSAETAEREADRALMAARESVRMARDHVRRLELEAEEEARLAKIKQHQAKDISKRGKQLGRHGI